MVSNCVVAWRLRLTVPNHSAFITQRPSQCAVVFCSKLQQLLLKL